MDNALRCRAGAIYIDELHKADLYHKLCQGLPVHSVGAMVAHYRVVYDKSSVTIEWASRWLV